MTFKESGQIRELEESKGRLIDELDKIESEMKLLQDLKDNAPTRGGPDSRIPTEARKSALQAAPERPCAQPTPSLAREPR